MSITVHDDVPVSTDQGLDGPQPADPETARVLMVFSDATKATDVLARHFHDSGPSQRLPWGSRPAHPTHEASFNLPIRPRPM